MRINNGLYVYILALVGLSALPSCVSFPKDYVTDEKVVFLMQDESLEPIRYEARPADPYEFEAPDTSSSGQNPSFLKDLTFEKLLKPDFKADAKLYNDAKAYFSSVLNLPLFEEMRSYLDKALIKAPPALAPNKGDKLKDYSNGAEYVYPDAPNASITVLDSGVYVIHFEDKSIFQYSPEGVYFWRDAKGKDTQVYNPKQDYILVKDGNISLESQPSYRGMTSPKGKIKFFSKNEPQYILEPADGSGAKYTYFLNDEKGIDSCAIETASGLRFDWFPSNDSVMITKGNESISITSNYQKFHNVFDTNSRKTTDLLSIYFPQGIRLQNLSGKGLSYAEVIPAWPESYLKKSIGPFDIWYTAKDEKLLSKIDASRLTEIEQKARTLSGLQGAQRRSVIIPPDLESYRKLHAQKKGDVLQWYPSGFETLDSIIMWPVSVPRYKSEKGQDYFFNTEFYEILIHEYTHILVGENSGVLSPLPIWLNEGLAVYIECQQFPEAKKYWDTTFTVSYDFKLLLPWDDVATKSTGEFPAGKARIHYAQSYGLVSKLIEKYGPAKLAAYIQSFRIKPDLWTKTDLKQSYKSNFRSVYGIEWDAALDLLKPKAGAK